MTCSAPLTQILSAFCAALPAFALSCPAQMAHLSQDPQLLAALAPHQADPFVALAAQWLRLPQEQVGAAPVVCSMRLIAQATQPAHMHA
jgi:hypothetical protein